MDGGGFHAITRAHAADDVFDQLAAAILRRELPPNEPLPPERVLAERFGVSRIIARQAIHRLAEVGLVRVRQGGATIVLDPEEAHDLRVVELVYRVGPASPQHLRDLAERQLLQGHAMLVLAAVRAAPPDLRAVAEFVAAQGGDLAEEAYVAFERAFWRRIAAAGKNRIFGFEVGWWARLQERRGAQVRLFEGPVAVRLAFYGEVARRLQAGEDAAQFFLDTLGPLVERVVVSHR